MSNAATESIRLRNALVVAEAVRSASPIPYLPGPDERRRLRIAAGVTQEVVAIVLDCPLASFVRWENGGIAPRPEGVRRYREVLGALAQIASKGGVGQAA